MKITKLTALFIFCLTAAVLAGCSKVNEISIGPEQNHSTVEVSAGDILVIELDANPSTGFAWEVEDLNTGILEQDGEIEFVQQKTDQELVGGAETELIRIKAVSSGETAIKLIYHRSWEEGVDPLETFNLNVVVK